MEHVLLHTDEAGNDHVEEVDSLDAAVERLQELHESGNTSGRIYRHVAVKVETVVRISVEEADSPSTSSSPPPPEPKQHGTDARRRIPSVDFVAPSS